MTKPVKIALAIVAVVFLLFAGAVGFATYIIIASQQGRTYFREGYTAEQRWQFDLARTKMTQALAKPLGNYWRSYALENRAYCYKQLYQREPAIRDYTESLRLNPRLTRAWLDRGLLYEEAGKRDQAIADYSQAIALDPNLGEAFYHRGVIYEGKHQYKEARADLEEAVRCYPNSASAYVQLGLANKQLGYTDKALANFEAAIGLNSKTALAYAGRGSIYFSKGDFNQATADASEAIRLGLHNGGAYRLRGLCYLRENRTSDALNDFSKALGLDPRDEAALQYRGLTYRRMKQYTESVVDLTELIKLTQAAGAYDERARTFSRSGEYSLALNDYKQAASSAAGTVKTQVKLLAWLRATCPDPKLRDGKEAVTLAIKDCNKSKWKNPDQIDTLAAAYAEIGDYNKAVAFEQWAIPMFRHNSDEVTEMKQRLALYQQHLPYREKLAAK